MSFKVRGFKSDKVLGTFATRDAAESFVDDYVTEHGGVLMIEEEPTLAPKKAKLPTAAQVKDAIAVDTVSVRQGVYTVRQGFFYRHGYTVEKLVELVKKRYPQATILDSGEVWKPFRGNQTTAQGSHWFVKFTLPEGD